MGCMKTQAPWDLERSLWLEGVDRYDALLAPEALLVFADPVGALDRAETLAALRAAPRWTSADFSRRRVAVPQADVCVLAYRVTAARDDGAAPTVATCSSTWLWIDGEAEQGGWRLVAHQQLPASVPNDADTLD